ncbi:MAG TPA: PilC/PilY family type IV pilus protein [Lysobacter sp.]
MNAKVWGTCSTAALVLGIATLTSGHDVQAGIAQSPLTLGGSVKPNLMLVLDDSGSMDWEMLFGTDEGLLYWNFQEDSFVNSSGAYFPNAPEVNDQATGRAYTYLFPNGRGDGNKAYPALTDRGNEGAFSSALPPRPEFAFARSPDYNRQYYNPALTYNPWVSSGAQQFANANASAALSDPTIPGSAKLNLTQDIYVESDEWNFRRSAGMRGADNGEPEDAVANNTALEGYRYYPATYYLINKTSIALPVWLGGGNCTTSAAPARYGKFLDDWTAARQKALPAGVDAIGPDGACLKKHTIAANTVEMQNFANWFQYHRKRHLALRASLGTVFDTVGGTRIGGIRINNASGDVTMRDIDASTDKETLYGFFYGMTGSQRGTPNRQALLHAAKQFDENRNIVQFTCQKNFTLHFTDGYTNLPPNGWGSGAGDADNDGYSNAIADIAAKYYKRIRADLTGGKVPAPAACGTVDAPVANPPAGMDCNFNPHMNTYGITLGAVGNTFGVTHHSVADAYVTTPTWPNPATAGKPQVDDLYHAAVNGHGEMLNASSTTELTLKLQQALADILAKGAGAGSRTAVSSSRAGNGNQLFQATFNSAQWTGELVAYDIANGSLGAVKWKAATLVPAHAARKISFGAAATSFEWTQLTAAQQTAFNRNPTTGTADALGEARIAWLRGDVSVQKAQGGSLRDRTTALGDIVNSSPRYVGAENFGYDRLPANAPGRNSYQAYRFGKSDRTPMVYVGANDGMLHAFDAKDGIEKWAWIPSEFLATDAAQPIPALSQLPRADYRHRYFVDGQPAAGDAYFDDKWHTVLVTPMGAGGRSIAALDITDTAVGAKVLWEFTDADLGHVVGQPSIQRMANGKFAAIFGSGYGLDASAKLFVVDIETGALLAKINTDPGFVAGSGKANGLSAPYPVDVNGDAVIDMIYAGDLWGNLWRFDVNSGTATSWAVHHGPSNAPRPLMTACASGSVDGPYACAAGYRQPITVRPVVGRGPGGIGQTIYFGTGKLFETGDNTLAEGAVGPVQSFYAVHDDNALTSVAGRGALLSQAILAELSLDEGTYRVTSNNALTGDHKGWYIDLVHAPAGFKGERVIADPVLQGGRIIFTTFMPGDACSGGSDGWLMELNARDGSRFTSPVIDINGDGLYTETTDDTQGDTLDHNGQQVPASGVKSTVGGLFTPNIINIPGTGNQRKLMQGAEGKIQEVGERDSVARGRTSWRQFWP